MAVPRVVADVLQSPGVPIDASVRPFMEAHLGRDFSSVRVHADARAAESAAAINARAYTSGDEVVFGAGHYSPSTTSGRHLLAHELTHVIQQSRISATGSDPSILNDERLEREANSRADAHEVSARAEVDGSSRRKGPVIQRDREPGWDPGWASPTGGFVSGWNAGEKHVGKIRRIPVDFLQLGNQEESKSGATTESAKGRAIVLLHERLDTKKPVQVLLHFHGMNVGYRQSGGSVRDEAIDRVEQQMEASSLSPQVVGVLPQGTTGAEFGKDSSGNLTFNSDAYLNEIFGTMAFMGLWVSSPKIGSVLLSGHSGAGGLINEKMLTGASGSSLPSKMGELALYDAINGPREFAAMKDWVKKQLDLDLSELSKRTTIAEKLAYLKSSMRVRVYYSTNPFYTKWTVGPLDKKHGLPLKPFIGDWFKTNAAALGGAGSVIHNALSSNYQVIAVGHSDHDKIVGKDDRLKEALDVLPLQRSAETDSETDLAPPIVYEVLKSQGHPLEPSVRRTFEGQFDRDFGAVAVHTGERASASAQALDALAYTVGNHIVFGAGRYSPETASGARLIAHELTHTLQQRGVSYTGSAALAINRAGDRLEGEADTRADRPSRSSPTPLAMPAIQRQPATQPTREQTCEAAKNPLPSKPGDCTYKEPENCPTYEEWISNFTKLKSFKARATPVPTTKEPHVFTVLGEEAVRGATPEKKGAAPRIGPKRLGEEFIDHPTDDWVKTCLPPNLRTDAYQLPADCADIAVILRHVWLSAHGRTETFGNWVIGDKAGEAAAGRVGKVIKEVYTGNVALMVNPYSDSKGNPLVSFFELEPLLHPGDVLVWAHFEKGFNKARTGGHTHTIAAIERDASWKITSISVLQGNEPIFGEEGKPGDDKGEIIKKLKIKDTKEARKELGESPGRRIEADKLSGSRDLGDSDPKTDKSAKKTWKWGETVTISSTPKTFAGTLLVAAGPPKAAPRPGMQTGSKVRQLSDWISPIKGAKSTSDLPGIFEAMLLEARAVIEGGAKISDDEATRVGQAAGQQLWKLAKAAKDLGNESHFEKIRDMRAMLKSIQNSRPISSLTRKADTPLDDIFFHLYFVLSLIDDAFVVAARGGSDIDFGKSVPAKTEVVKTLLTGFDPFNISNVSKAPRKGEWNPSGAAVMALDGERIKADKGVIAAVEGVVLPVDFYEFKSGLVEKMVKPYASEVDAVITVSLDASLTGKPVRLERYAVGVHQLNNGVLEAVPAADGGTTGPAIIESNAPLDEIKSATKGGSDKIAEPDIGTDILFVFESDVLANRAIKALGSGTLKTDRLYFPEGTVEISDAKVIGDIIRQLAGRSGPTIQFKAANETFNARVLSGPGGNFLSNEVSYRMLRLLSETKSARDPFSFHVHTQGGGIIPQNTSTKEAKKKQKEATSAAMGVRGTLISTLRRMITGVAKIIVGRRKAKP